MRVLGIDPGYAIVGWSVLDFNEKSREYALVDFGVITTEKGLPIEVRLEEIFNDLNFILRKFKPEIAGMETLFFQNNAKTAIDVGQGRGVIMLALQQAGIQILQMNPLQVKNSITGYGKADKAQVQEVVRVMLGLEEIPKPDDAADAVAIAVAAVDRYRENKL